EAQHPNFPLSISWQADYPIFRIKSRLTAMSALPPKADIVSSPRYVCFVPIATERAAASNMSIRSPRRRARAASAAHRGRAHLEIDQRSPIGWVVAGGRNVRLRAERRSRRNSHAWRANPTFDRDSDCA